jgi:hypothetical protein
MPTPRRAPHRRTDHQNPGSEAWIEVLDPDRFGATTPEERRAVASHWERSATAGLAAATHLARLSLQLLSLGAPPGLLTGAHEAATDAIDRARFAASLASAFSPAPLAPARRRARDVRVATELGAIVRELVEEGCVGATIAVVEAMSMAEQAHPALRDALALFASDQARQSALGWAALAWIVETHGGDAGRFAVAALDRAVASSLDVSEHVAVAVPELGVLASSDKAAARLRALREVIAPVRDEIARRANAAQAA